MNVCTGMIMYTLYSIAPLRVWYIRRERGEVAEILYVISAIDPPPPSPKFLHILGLHFRRFLSLSFAAIPPTKNIYLQFYEL